MTALDTRPAAAEQPSEEGAERTGLVDADLHISTINGMKDIYPYMPLAWRRRFELKNAGTQYNPLPLKFKHPTDNAIRPDSAEYPGAVPASSPEFVKKDYLDRFKIDFGIATSLEAAAFASAMASPDEANVLSAAFNDYFCEHWCEYDTRYRYAMCVGPMDPEAAAAEIRRRGTHPGVAAVYLAQQNVLLGNRLHYPIYEAAQELDLPILLHLAGTEGAHIGAMMPAGGVPESFSERRAGYFQYAMANVNSLAFSQVFVKFPRLRFAFIEMGFSWLLSTLWRLDATWKATRIETPWLTELPSETLKRHVRFGTQPVEEPANPKDFYTLLQMLATDWLMFTTDYPHWDGDEPETVFKRLDPYNVKKIMRANGEWMFRLS